MIKMVVADALAIANMSLSPLKIDKCFLVEFKKPKEKENMWEDGNLLDKEGSEGGQVLKDEIYTKGSRITLEKCSNYYAITCAVFGAFCHTTFCGEKESLILYKQIKMELQAFMDKETLEEEEIAFYRYFSEKY